MRACSARMSAPGARLGAIAERALFLPVQLPFCCYSLLCANLFLLRARASWRKPLAKKRFSARKPIADARFSLFFPCSQGESLLWFGLPRNATACLARRRLRLWPAMTEFAFPFPLLVCDTGGTNVRFALADEPGAPWARRPPEHRRLPGARRGDRGGRAEARIEAALGDRLRRRPGRRADAQAHQRALGHGRPRGGAPDRPCPRVAAQRLRGPGALAAGGSRSLGEARSVRWPSGPRGRR